MEVTHNAAILTIAGEWWIETNQELEQAVVNLYTQVIRAGLAAEIDGYSNQLTILKGDGRVKTYPCFVPNDEVLRQATVIVRNEWAVEEEDVHGEEPPTDVLLADDLVTYDQVNNSLVIDLERLPDEL